jgi:carboxypeptidase Q
MISKRAANYSGAICALCLWLVTQAFQNALAQDATASATQAIREQIDLSMYSRIRGEGFEHSHVMEYSSGLADGIGGRLTGSPNMKRAYSWGLLQLRTMGASNVHLEDWSEFGMDWRQRNTWLRMVSPDTAVFVAQAAPWSASSNGTIRGKAVAADIQQEKDFDLYRGRLTGKVVFLGLVRDVPPLKEPLFLHYSPEQIATGIPQGPIENYFRNRKKNLEDWGRKNEFQRKLAKFLESERVLAVIVPSRDSDRGGGTGILFVDNAAILGAKPWLSENLLPFPVVVTMVENYGRAPVC